MPVTLTITDETPGVTLVIDDGSPGVTVINEEVPGIVISSATAPGPQGPQGPPGPPGADGAGSWPLTQDESAAGFDIQNIGELTFDGTTDATFNVANDGTDWRIPIRDKTNAIIGGIGGSEFGRFSIWGGDSNGPGDYAGTLIDLVQAGNNSIWIQPDPNTWLLLTDDAELIAPGRILIYSGENEIQIWPSTLLKFFNSAGIDGTDAPTTTAQLADVLVDLGIIASHTVPAGASWPLDNTGATAATDAMTLDVAGDTQNRFVINHDGSIEWGSGSGAADVTLARGTSGGAHLAVRSKLNVISGTLGGDGSWVTLLPYAAGSTRTSLVMAEVWNGGFGPADYSNAYFDVSLSYDSYMAIDDLDLRSDGTKFYTKWPLLLNPVNAAYLPLTIKGAAAQSANLTEWQDSAGAVQLAVQPDGDIVMKNLASIYTANGAQIMMYYGTVRIPYLSSTQPEFDTWVRIRSLNQVYTPPTLKFHAQENGFYPNEGLGEITFGKGSTTLIGARILSYGIGTWNVASSPAYLSFQTTPTGAVDAIERLKIDENGLATFSASVMSQRTAGTDIAFQTKRAADSTSRFSISADGWLAWSDGAVTPNEAWSIDGSNGSFLDFYNYFDSRRLIMRLASTGTAFYYLDFLTSNSGIYRFEAASGPYMDLKSQGIGGPTRFPSQAVGQVPLTVKGFAAQTASLQEWHDSAGATLLSIDSGGSIKSGGSAINIKRSNGNTLAYFAFDNWYAGSVYHRAFDGNCALEVRAVNAGGKVVKVRGTTSQTGVLQEWDDVNDVILASVSAAGLGTFAGLSITDAKDVAIGTTTGTKIGTATTQKIGFWNATPVVQPAAIADATGGAVVDTEARAALNDLLAKLRTAGIIAT